MSSWRSLSLLAGLLWGTLGGALAAADQVAEAVGDEAVTATAPQDLATRVAALEQELAALRELLAPIRQRQETMKRQQELQRMVQARREAEQQTLSEAERQKLETLFRTATQQWNKPEGEAALAALTEQFPQSDRTASAYLQTGQMRRDEIGEAHLRFAAEKFEDNCNLAGLKIGPLARFFLAMRLWNGNRKDEARILFQELRERFPDAIGPRGNRLIENLPADPPEAASPAKQEDSPEPPGSPSLTPTPPQTP